MQRRRRIRFRPSPAQLALPLDYSLSVRAAPSRSHGRSKAKRTPWPQVRPATNPAMRARRGFVPATLGLNKPVNSFRQPQRFTLTSLISTLIHKVNGKRWPYAAALSPFLSRQVALVSDRGAHVGRGSVGSLPRHPLGRNGWRAKLPALWLLGLLYLQDPQGVPVQRLLAPIYRDIGNDLRQPQDANSGLLAGNRDLREWRKGS